MWVSLCVIDAWYKYLPLWSQLVKLILKIIIFVVFLAYLTIKTAIENKRKVATMVLI